MEYKIAQVLPTNIGTPTYKIGNAPVPQLDVFRSAAPIFKILANIPKNERPFNIHSTDDEDKTLVFCCPNCSQPMNLSKGGKFVCSQRCPFIIHSTFAEYLLTVDGKTFFKEDNLENQHLFYPRCERCKTVGVNVWLDSKHCSFYCICKTNRIAMTINPEYQYDPSSTIGKIKNLMFNERYDLLVKSKATDDDNENELIVDDDEDAASRSANTNLPKGVATKRNGYGNATRYKKRRQDDSSTATNMPKQGDLGTKI